MQIESVIHLPDDIKEKSRIIQYMTNKLQQSSLTQSIVAQVQDSNYTTLDWHTAEPVQLGSVKDWGVKSIPGVDPYVFTQDTSGRIQFGNLGDST